MAQRGINVVAVGLNAGSDLALADCGRFVTLGTGTLSSGKASFTTTSLSVGSHGITAVYGGDVTYTGSTSSAQVSAPMATTPLPVRYFAPSTPRPGSPAE